MFTPRRFVILRRAWHLPFPIPNFRQILAVFVNVMFVLDEFVLHLLFQIGTLGTQMRHAIHHVLHEMKAVEVVLHAHIECRRDRPFFLVAADVKVAVRAAIGQPVDEPRVAMETKNDVLVFGEERIVIRFAQSVRMFALRIATSSGQRH